MGINQGPKNLDNHRCMVVIVHGRGPVINNRRAMVLLCMFAMSLFCCCILALMFDLFSNYNLLLVSVITTVKFEPVIYRYSICSVVFL